MRENNAKIRGNGQEHDLPSQDSKDFEDIAASNYKGRYSNRCIPVLMSDNNLNSAENLNGGVRLLNNGSSSPRKEEEDVRGHNKSTRSFNEHDNGENDDGFMSTDIEGKSSDVDDDQFTSEYLTWYNPIRRFCGSIVNDMRFQFFIVFLILINALCMGIATYDFVEENSDVDRAFEIVDLVFLIIFTIESALQFGYHGYQLFYDGWLTFDLLVVIMSWSMNGAQIFRSFRIFRAFRLVARLDVLKHLVNAIVSVLPRIGSIMVLLCLVLYIFSVLCTILFGEHRYGEDQLNYFGRLDCSLFTLFQFVTLDGWGDVSRDVMDIYPWAGIVFLGFLTVSSFILYSLVVAVVCDAVAVVEHPDIALKKFEDKMQREKTATTKRVRKMASDLAELSEQQMDILLSVQNRLMQFQSFRDDAEISRKVTVTA